ncbi:unnamed protein product [Durusdinium trenchii]|uniref:Uncharacterized protein n=1 Tax=Durusdinium trenchii TaxID=1381693 RepID=A0ABP0HFQ4_9DINO
MGELFTKYYRLQEVNRNLAAETKVAVVSELLEILDDLERGASQDGGTGASSSLKTLAKKFEARPYAGNVGWVESCKETFEKDIGFMAPLSLCGLFALFTVMLPLPHN